jgi:hypothetical protein
MVLRVWVVGCRQGGSGVWYTLLILLGVGMYAFLLLNVVMAFWRIG